LGIDPASVLRKAGLPLTLCTDENSQLTPEQFMSIWRALGELSQDPGLGLKFGSQLPPTAMPPSMMAAHYARDYRDALTRHARFLQIGKFSELSIREFRDESSVEWKWPRAIAGELPFLTDVTFAMLVEMGRRGTDKPLNPKRVELRRPPEQTGVHRAHFKCPVRFNTPRNLLVFHTEDLERPFVTYNAELLEMLQPSPTKALRHTSAKAPVTERVRWVLKQILSSGRPDAAAVARELGLGVRTLQRRIMDEGYSFRELLAQVRQELCIEYLNQPEIQIQEIAFLLGYEDVTSFYRAFCAFEGTTPALKRIQLIQ
jgi:AraC-like DNA-binding protein